jgi:hypothetical protein
MTGAGRNRLIGTMAIRRDALANSRCGLSLTAMLVPVAIYNGHLKIR